MIATISRRILRHKHIFIETNLDKLCVVIARKIHWKLDGREIKSDQERAEINGALYYELRE